MKIVQASRYTFTGCYPDCFRPAGHCTPAELDENLHRYKELAGGLPAFAITAAWAFDSPPFRFPLDLMEVMDNRGVVPLVIFWPYPPLGLDQINSGELDAVFRERAREVCDWGRPCLAQVGTEITLAGYPWAAANNGGWGLTGNVDGRRWPIGPSKYIHAARRIHRIFGDAGCELTWNWQTFPEFGGNNFNRPRWYWPGLEFVDWVGIPLWIDPGTPEPFDTFESCLETCLIQIEEIAGAGEQPVYVEIMCQENLADPEYKPQFFRDCYSRLFTGEYERLVRHGGAIGIWDAYTATQSAAVASGPPLKFDPYPFASDVPARMGIDSSTNTLLAYQQGVSQPWHSNKARLA